MQTSQPHDTYRCYLGLGANLSNELGTPSEHIERALTRLQSHSAISHMRASSLYASKPMGPQDQPDFINAVAEIDTTLDPYELLALCQQLEQEAQRVRLRRWGERSLDVDVLLYANRHLHSATLTVPHPGITERNFVLIPLAELDPNLIIGDTAIDSLACSHDWTGLTRLTSD